jgi:sterol desaturase/sphingolipid hydroxylase (fatty acid hydroxylase superfamily)
VPALLALGALGRACPRGAFWPVGGGARFFELLWAYKVWVEVAGHTGVDAPRATSFPQCVWLPRALGCALRTAEHEQHHLSPGCNFSKRFTLWDRVFGTYSPAKSHAAAA